MNNLPIPNALERLLCSWVHLVCHRPITSLVVIAMITLAATWVTYNQFNINSKLTNIIVQDTQWRRDFDEFKAHFPELVDTAVVVISGQSAIQTRQVAQQLAQQFKQRSDYFTDVFSLSSDDFFYHNALLYQNLDELYDTADQLALAQPFLTRIVENPSIDSLLDLINDSINPELDEVAPEGLKKVIRALNQSAETHNNSLTPQLEPLPWLEYINNDERKIHYQTISLKGKPDFQQELPHSLTIKRIRDVIADVTLPSSVQVRLTGEVALSHEEITAAKDGVKLAGALSLIALALLIYFGVRSKAITVIALLFISIGSLWTTALGLLLVGHFNTLSLLFMVMFFGLAIDFFLHFSLRYEEATYQWIDEHQNSVLPKSLRFKALLTSSRSIGTALLMCALTTSISFLSFSFTKYTGLAELGVISAGGMLVAIILTFSLLPVLYFLIPLQKSIHNPKIASFQHIIDFLAHHRKTFIALTLICFIAAIAVIPKLTLEGSVLALRDKQSESVSTLEALQENGIITDYSLFMFKQQPSTQLIQQLEALDTVDKVRTLNDYIPKDMDDKLFILEDLQFLLESAITPQSHSQQQSTSNSTRQLIKTLQNNIKQYPQDDNELQQLLNQFNQQLTLLIEKQRLNTWSKHLIDPVNEQLDWLSKAIHATEISTDDLPLSLINRLTAKNISDRNKEANTNDTINSYLLSAIIPTETIIEDSQMRKFINEVYTLAPHATGRPVVEIGLSDLVKIAFFKAVVIALTSIILLLLIKYRQLSNIIWVLTPLVLTTLFTLSCLVIFDISFNLANILVIPLIFGLSVDNGIHVIDRYNRRHNIDSLVQSSTPRAVLLSSLTTLCSFASLSLSPHVGTATIGLLLTISVIIMFVVTVIILPVIIKIVNHREHNFSEHPTA